MPPELIIPNKIMTIPPTKPPIEAISMQFTYHAFFIKGHENPFTLILLNFVSNVYAVLHFYDARGERSYSRSCLHDKAYDLGPRQT